LVFKEHIFGKWADCKENEKASEGDEKKSFARRRHIQELISSRAGRL
jgi:hypothetical protein